MDDQGAASRASQAWPIQGSQQPAVDGQTRPAMTMALHKGGQNTRYPIPEPELPEPRPEVPKPELPDHNFG
jgi:hypothetical protein